ncbi:hypothetical protein TPELB_15140 [Terrisporobacter petrolearius]|uniref:Uncharacterized protein n=1 Tax=Terrisporobacter petrolearius TaxID=1460447 RepID=A0ABZ3FE07_9FIRM
MKGLIENLFWIIVIILGSLYLLFIEIRSYKYRRSLKLKIKYTEEDTVSMEIMNKIFSKGTTMKIGGDILPSKLPGTYIVELEYDGNKYEINDKEIFNSYEVGQLIKLVKSLDQNKNVIKYDLFKLK